MTWGDRESGGGRNRRKPARRIGKKKSWITYPRCAMITLGFAIFVELIFAPLNQTASMTLVSTNFGIVLAYCGLQLYWLDLVKQRMQK